MKWYILLTLIVSASSRASFPSQPEKLTADLATDKVTCPVGYQLVDGTYRIVEGGEPPKHAYVEGNTLIIKYKKTHRVQAIAVCARIPL